MFSSSGECNYAKTVWRASGISNSIINSTTASLEEKMEEYLRYSTHSHMANFQDLPSWMLS